jgi:RNA polymerase sigma-70 factor (ECF subfamily)
MRESLTSPEGFEAVVREHQLAVFRTLTRLTGSGAHVEDLAQEVFLRLYRALPNFRGDAAIATYLYRIAFNVAQDEWKRRRRERSHIADTPVQDEDEASWVESLPGDTLQGHARNPEQLLADAQLQHAVECALQGLSDVERAVLVLYHQEECSYEGIAAALELPINTVRTHLHRGRKKLAEALQTRAPPAAARHHNELSTHMPAVAGRRL